MARSNVPKAKVKSRIILTPEHAKRLLEALQENVNKFETAFGPIKTGGETPSFPMNFGGTIMKLTAQEVIIEPVSHDLFTVPEDYEIITDPEDMKWLMP